MGASKLLYALVKRSRDFSVSAAEKNWKCGTRVTVAAEKLGSIKRCVTVGMESNREIMDPISIRHLLYTNNGVLQRERIIGQFSVDITI